MIVEVFKKHYIVDGRDRDILWEDEEEVENVGSERGEVGNCEDRPNGETG
jgi:hypothetical protein